MVVAIHQAHYLPWLRYVEKLARSDCFVLLDDVQFEKNGFQNRTKIKGPQGWTYLTVPIRKPVLRPIREIEIDNSTNWPEKHRRTLESCYRKAPHWEPYGRELLALYEQPWERLAELNRAFLGLLLRQLDVKTPIVPSSEIPTSGLATQRLVELCTAVGGDTYLSGTHAAHAYLDTALFESSGVRLAFQQWEAPEYRQLYPSAGFIPELSIVDLLLNEGPRSLALLLDAGSVEAKSAAA